jgi:NAD-dependent oxidoreductase involved in siderophore biosynthesis
VNGRRDDGRLGVAILGVAHLHALSYGQALAASPTARLVGFHDASPELAERAADHLDCPYQPDLDALLDGGDVEAVIVCSATNGHRALVEQAAARGLHVLCEKPIATTIADAEAMIEACATHGVQLHTAFVTRFYPLVAQVRDAVSLRPARRPDRHGRRQSRPAAAAAALPAVDHHGGRGGRRRADGPLGARDRRDAATSAGRRWCA